MENIIEKIKNTVLEDNGSPYGGIEYPGETLENFLGYIDPDDIGKPVESLTIREINALLRECGIKPIKSPGRKAVNQRNYYYRRQMQLRGQAIEWQICCDECNVESYTDIPEKQEYFRYWGKRFGLLREFAENAII